MNLESSAKAPNVAGISILVVEDDIEIRHILATRLRESGFIVSEASNASEALRLIGTGIHVDTLITDVEMPGDMNGVGLAEQARTHRPSLHIIVVSGINIGREVRGQGMTFFQKPYDFASLVKSITEDWTR